MNKQTMIYASALLVLSAIVPAAAYHITAQTAAPGLTSSDWALDNSALIICESDGLGDPRNTNDVPLFGLGGLCTSGRQDYFADGLVIAGELLPPTAAPAKGTLTELDVCNLSVADRVAGGTCNTATIGFTAEVGIYSCFVRGGDAVFPVSIPAPGDLPSLTTDRSLYYDELYAWWSYDGNTTQGDGPGFHGHVAVFPGPINRSTSSPQLVAGSVSVTAAAALPAGAVNCGGSPAGNGPVAMG